MECAEFESKYTHEPAGKILKGYIKLMDKYSDYFFDQPWPKDYNFEAATSFNETDHAFLAANNEEYGDRFQTMLLKKNLYLNGFNTMGMLLWTQQSYEKQFTSKEENLLS